MVYYPPLLPPPHQRPNWSYLNEGQKRYAEEQYALARVRRGMTYNAPNVSGTAGGEASQGAASSTSNVHQLSDSEADSDEEDMADSSSSPIKLGDQQQAGTSGSNKRNLSDEGGGSSKKSKVTDEDMEVGGPSNANLGSQLPGTSGQMGAGGTMGGVSQHGMPVSVPRGLKNISNTITFHKQWKVLSYGVANRVIEKDGYAYLTTSLVNIPWEYAFWYMSPAEWKTCQTMPGVRAKHCSLKITQFNPRVAFQTGDTTSTTATYNQNKFTLVGKGLRSNDALWGFDHIYTYDDVEPMKPTAVTPVNQSYRGTLSALMYGYPNDDVNFLEIVPAYTTGGEFALEAYYTMENNLSDPIGWQPLQNYISEYNSMDCMGKVIVDETYKFNNAYITPRVSAIANDGTQFAHNNLIGTHRKTFELITETTRGADPPINPLNNNSMRYVNMIGSTTNNNNVFSTPNRYLNFPLEQSPTVSDMTASDFGPRQQPSVHVGLRAVPKLSSQPADQSVNSWADAQMYWICNASITLECGYPHVFNLETHGLPRMAEVVHGVLTSDTPPAFVPQMWSYDGKFNFGHPVLTEVAP